LPAGPARGVWAHGHAGSFSGANFSLLSERDILIINRQFSYFFEKNRAVLRNWSAHPCMTASSPGSWTPCTSKQELVENKLRSSPSAALDLILKTNEIAWTTGLVSTIWTGRDSK
jgi:hypothetical protein